MCPLRAQPARRAGGETRFDSFIYMHTIGRPTETIIQCVGLMYAGIPEKFSKLRIAFLECGAGWVPYWMERMDEEWEKRGDVEAPLCKQKPSEYITHGNWFFATEPEEEMLPYVIERIGEDRIVFASDYPHWDALFPNVVSTIRGRKDISERAKEKILGKMPMRSTAGMTDLGLKSGDCLEIAPPRRGGRRENRIKIAFLNKPSVSSLRLGGEHVIKGNFI